MDMIDRPEAFYGSTTFGVHFIKRLSIESRHGLVGLLLQDGPLAVGQQHQFFLP